MITISALIIELQKLERDGRGENPVYVHQYGADWCPRADRVEAFHTAKSGHVVIGGERRVPQ